MTLSERFKNIDTVEGRTYDPSKLLDHKIMIKVYDEFREAVPRIFGNNLVFGFVFGGFAKGYAVNNQDADFFISLHDYYLEQIAEFHEWYFDLHERYGFAPDLEMPGSITTLAHLQEKISYAARTPLRPVIESSYEKQCIVWADLMSGEKAAKIGDLNALNEIEVSCEGITQRWRKELLTMLGEKATLDIAKLPITRLFRHSVKYLKEGDRMIPPAPLS
jgi:hypothetical protein